MWRGLAIQEIDRLPFAPALVEVSNADGPVAHLVNQMLAHGRWQVVPILDLGHQSPKTMRPS